MQEYNPPFTYRRVDFLRGCPPNLYLQAMRFLGRYGKLCLVSYEGINDEINVGRILHYVCGHVVFWADPNWKPPYKTSSEATQSFYDYTDVIRNVYLPEAEWTGDRDRDDAKERKRHDKVEAFMDSVRRRIRKDYPLWYAIKQNVRRTE